MKTVWMRASYTHRKFGPGFIAVSEKASGSTVPIAVSKAFKKAWKSLDTKARNDVKTGGMKLEIRESDNA